MRKCKKTLFWLLGIYFIAAAYVCGRNYGEITAHIPPAAERRDISYIYNKSVAELTGEDFDTIFRQTGLGRAAVEDLPSLSMLEEYAAAYYAPVEFECIRNSPVSSEEYVANPQVKLAKPEKGDILLTSSSHVCSWRNGHAAIVIGDGTQTLEAVVIGSLSSVQSIEKWRHYPNILVLRLKGASAEERAAIADAAAENLEGIKYNVFSGVFTKKYVPLNEISGTQCAHLVWSAYAQFGYDIDSDGGLIVTPHDITESDLLEVVQSYGRG